MKNIKNYLKLLKILIILLVISGINIACSARLGPAYITGYSHAKQPPPQPIVAVPLRTMEPKLRIQAKGKLKFTLDSVFFAIDKADLLPEGHQKIVEFANSIQRYGPTSIVEINGYTDSTGAETYNQYLSEDRASTVRDALTARGIDPNILFVQGFGESNPLATNTTNEGRQQNRRVEITVIK